QRRDDQTQAQFEAEWAEENANWVPPAEMLSISPKAETDFHSQIKDKTLYSELVCEGQKDGESDQEFMNQLHSMTLTTEEYRSSPKRVFQYVPDDKSDGDSSSKQQDSKSAEPKHKQQPSSAPQPKPVPQKQQTVPPKQQTAPQKQEKKGVPQAQSKKVAQSLAKPLTLAAYHAKVIRQMLHYFGRVWTGIINARYDLAYRKDITIREDPMTSEEREKFDSTPARYILPPQELFSPQDKPVERTNWWLEITG
ncbi:MAG: hypothetical protein GY816_18210, partial [Cytophagales bacterium]|nr:hypothetical protein [Cytophagales bacterium]